jgi:predicted RecB family nuclease
MSTQNLPRPTAGHHFSDLLICPYKAWLHYYGDTSQKVEAPPFLRALLQEGLAYEEAVYQEKYPGALRIRGGKSEQRLKETYDAMCAGEPVILQGYVYTKSGVGILDVLKCIGVDPASKTGYAYNIGEIKSSSSLKTQHILQVSWYAELLKEAFGLDTQEAFVILKNYRSVPLDLGKFQEDYVNAKQTLFNIRDGKITPEPFLSPFCPSCDWRIVCMPILVSQSHISLLPGFSRNQIRWLKGKGIDTWQKIKASPDQILFEIGKTEYETHVARANIGNLEENMPVLRQQLRSGLLDNATVLVVEFPDFKQQREEGSPLRPSAVVVERNGRTLKVPVRYDGDVPSADISFLDETRTVLVFGSTDLHTFQRLARKSGVSLKNIDVLDLLTLIEKYVHYPFHGLELGTVYNHALGIENPDTQQHLNPDERVNAIRAVSNWLKRALW